MIKPISLEGITKPQSPDYIARCPTACTKDHCVISTVGVCKHPCLTGDQGCGPITMANRAAALKFLGVLPKPIHQDAVR